MDKFPSPSFINVDGWEIHINEGTLAIPRDCPKETRSNARNYIKGLRKLWTASKTKGFFEAAGEKVHGNVNTQESATSDMVRRIGEGFSFSIESYVDGSYSICVESNK